MLTEHGITKLPSVAQQEADAARYRRELEVNMRDTPRPNVDTPDNEPEDPDAVPDDQAEANGPPSRRTRSRAGASELADWNSLAMTPIDVFASKGALCLNVGLATTVEGVNYNETYTATSKAIAIRMFLNMIMALGMHGRKFDVPKAFTKADIDSDIWVLQPEERRLPGLLCKKK